MLRRTSLFVPLLLVSVAFAAGSGPDKQFKNGHFETSDHVRLHYLEAGDGPGMVLVPGWTIPAWIWEAQIKHFAEHYHVVALDPRSQAESQKVSFGNYPERRAEDIRELVDALHLAPAILVGWSLAVSDLLTYAERFGGNSVRAYVLVDGFAWDKLDPGFLTAIIPFYRQIQTDRAEFTDNFVRGMFKKKQPEEYLKRLIVISQEMPADSAIASSVSSVARADWTPAVRRLDRPVLIACQAPTKGMAAGLIQSNVPWLKVEVFEDAGHALFVDDADRFNSVVDEFLAHPPGP